MWYCFKWNSNQYWEKLFSVALMCYKGMENVECEGMCVTWP